MNDFKLNYYYHEFKDKPLPTREEFRNEFKKKYGKFEFIEQLIKKIENHQMRKYGRTLYYDSLKIRNRKIIK